MKKPHLGALIRSRTWSSHRDEPRCALDVTLALVLASQRYIQIWMKLKRGSHGGREDKSATLAVQRTAQLVFLSIEAYLFHKHNHLPLRIVFHCCLIPHWSCISTSFHLLHCLQTTSRCFVDDWQVRREWVLYSLGQPNIKVSLDLSRSSLTSTACFLPSAFSLWGSTFRSRSLLLAPRCTCMKNSRDLSVKLPPAALLFPLFSYNSGCYYFFL